MTKSSRKPLTVKSEVSDAPSKTTPSLLNKALAATISGDIYSLKKTINKGFKLEEKDHLCITEAARLGHDHIVGYILNKNQPPKNILKKVCNICADNFKHSTLTKIIKTTGVYSKTTKDIAQHAGNTQSVDYLMDREIYEEVGEFYKQYKHLPQRIIKLLCYTESDRKYIDGDPAPIGFSNANPEVVRILRGAAYKTETSTMLQICCREGLKDAAEVFLLATKMQKKMGLGYKDWKTPKEEGRNHQLTYTASFGSELDYNNLKGDAIFIGAKNQKHNLGYTISLAIKNRNYSIAEDLIKNNYCPEPSIEKTNTSICPKTSKVENVFDDKYQPFDIVIKTLIKSEDQEEAAQVLMTLLNQTHSEKNIKLNCLFQTPEFQKESWKYALIAIETGKEQIAKIFLKNIDLVNLQKQKYHNSIPKDYALDWLRDYQKMEMIKEKSTRSPSLEL